MSVLIKGMDMPESCYACDMMELSGVVRCCHAYDTRNSDWGRALNCPLIPVPTPHGRLKDADELNKLINQSYPMTDRVDVHNGYAIVQEMMKQLPTIIPADRAEKEGEA